MADIIYILTNEAMPQLVKIGCCTISEVEDRISQLSSPSGIPLPFDCYYAAEVENARKLERKLHELFSEKRINPKREFFQIEPEKAVLAITIGPAEEITPGHRGIDETELEALSKVKKRKSPIKLAAIGIKDGDELTFSRDESITATVASGNKVDFRGEILSLSEAAKRVLHEMGYKTPAASGSFYWGFDGELLCERRQRIENEQFDEDSNEE